MTVLAAFIWSPAARPARSQAGSTRTKVAKTSELAMPASSAKTPKTPSCGGKRHCMHRRIGSNPRQNSEPDRGQP
eukprot:866216-Pyramimonas_sp.AAC.1